MVDLGVLTTSKRNQSIDIRAIDMKRRISERDIGLY